MSDSESVVPAKNEAIELIGLVRERKCLWDRRCTEYRNKYDRLKAWEEICEVLDPNFHRVNNKHKNKSVLLMSKKWTNIRDAYVKSLRMGRNRVKPYIHAEALEFLDAVFVYKTKSSQKVDSRLSDEDNATEDSIEWLNEVYVDESAVEDPPPKKPKLEYPQDENSIAHFLMNLVQREENEDRAFFTSITSAVSSLSERSKFEFRVQVLKLLNSLRMKDSSMGVKRERNIFDSETE